MKLLIADDHTLFRDALLQYIQRADPQAKVVLAKDFYETQEILERDQDFDLVILDLRMPGMVALAGVQKIRSTHPDLRVAIMSGVAEKEQVQEALDLGIAGYFPKTLSGKALIRAIETVLDGQIFVPYEQGSRYIRPAYYDDGFFDHKHEEPPEVEIKETPINEEYNLTQREKDVLFYLVTGASNKEIANALDLQVVTVKLHVRGICRKLGAKNRTQAALIAQENRIVVNMPPERAPVSS